MCVCSWCAAITTVLVPMLVLEGRNKRPSMFACTAGSKGPARPPHSASSSPAPTVPQAAAERTRPLLVARPAHPSGALRAPSPSPARSPPSEREPLSPEREPLTAAAASPSSTLPSSPPPPSHPSPVPPSSSCHSSHQMVTLAAQASTSPSAPEATAAKEQEGRAFSQHLQAERRGWWGDCYRADSLALQLCSAWGRVDLPALYPTWLSLLSLTHTPCVPSIILP